MKLNLGSGRVLLDGYVNVDKFDCGQDVILDIEKEKWPWEDNSVDEIYASHVLEHLHELIYVMNEAWRVLKPGGEFLIMVPCYPHPEAFQDPTHVRFFVPNTFLYFTKENPSGGSIGFEGEFKIAGMAKELYELRTVLEAVK